MTGVAVLVVDKIGRRPLLLGGVSGLTISLFLLGAYYTFLGSAPAVAVVALLFYVGYYQIGTVHKCMTKGAADFLMKPIRIIELKNLWQHVWRRQSCQSAIGFGLSLQVESVEQMKIDEATAENNTVSDQSSVFLYES